MIAFITGSGFYDLPGLSPQEVETRFGSARVLTGKLNGDSVLVLPRHGNGHRFLPHQIPYRANIAALKKCGATAIVSCSVCGVVCSEWRPGTAFVADDLWFPENRLGDGTACSMFDQPGEPGRGHLLASTFFHAGLSAEVRNHFLKALGACESGCYAHVNGPRFNSAAEIRALRTAGVDFLSQTCGPEAVLANECELPFALAGFGVDFANGVADKPTPVDELTVNLERSREAFAGLIQVLASNWHDLPFEQFVYRFE